MKKWLEDALLTSGSCICNTAVLVVGLVLVVVVVLSMVVWAVVVVTGPYPAPIQCG